MLHFYECFARCTFMHLYICIIAPHSGTIDEPREGRDIGTEHEDDVWWTYPEEAKNQEYMLGPEYSPSECHLTNTDLVLIPGGAEAGASAHSRASSTGNTQTERSAQQTERSSRRPAPRRPPGCTTDRTVYRAGISRHGWLRPPYKYKNVKFCEEILLI